MSSDEHVFKMLVDKPRVAKLQKSKVNSFVSDKKIESNHPSEPHEDSNGFHHCQTCGLFLISTNTIYIDTDFELEQKTFHYLLIHSAPHIDGLIRPPIRTSES